MIKRFLILCLFFPLFAFAGIPLGEKLTKQLWKDINAGKIDKIMSYTSKNFQAIDGGVVYTQPQLPDLLSNYELIDAEIVDMVITKGKNVIVVVSLMRFTSEDDKYAAFYPKDVRNNHFSIKKTDTDAALSAGIRVIDVWKKIGHTWKWAGQVNNANNQR